MHPEIRRDAPGLCPECGMRLLPEKAESEPHGGHGGMKMPDGVAPPGKHEGHSLAIFARKFWVSLFLTLPVVLQSGLWQKISGRPFPSFPGSAFFPFALGSIIFFYGGWVFLQGALREVRARLPGMMTLIAIAISAAYAYSVYATFSGKSGDLYWELTTLITVMLLGHWLEMRAVQSTQGALKELSKLLPDTVEVVRNGKPEIVELSELREGDLFIVRPGGKVAADGVVAEGKTELDESMVTGESRPVRKGVGSEVIAGTVNGDGSLTVRVTKIGEKTFLAGVMRLVAEAQASKSRLQILSDRAAQVLTVIAVGGGFLTLTAWLFVAEPGYAVERMVAVLVIACPHALGLAVPLVASISTMLAAKNGFLVKQRLALEAAKDVDVVLFDKTGTLTKGAYGVDRVWNFSGADTAEVLRLAAAVDGPSEHVIAKAIAAKARQDGISVQSVSDFSRVPGKGVKGIVAGEEISAGGRALLEQREGAVPGRYGTEIDAENKKGKTVVYVLKGGQPFGAIALADVIREESRQAVADLKNMGLKVAMITGDSEDVAAWVAGELGIDEVFAKVLPEKKAEKVKLLQQKGQKVAMVGDGINDAPALTQADLGIAIGAGTNVAIESAGIILVRNDPRDIPKIITLSRRTYAKMIQNILWASGYNIVALPLAAGALAFKGIVLQPAWSAVFMSLSTVIVAVNAMALRKAKLGRE
ncbi:heavy metal translocating P-type ATPase [Candidatus Uhrbacteria bacterium]|nr:heavy metal translocating P-type ATPase [Candidatus Uhrbacteria bacterium]